MRKVCKTRGGGLVRISFFKWTILLNIVAGAFISLYPASRGYISAVWAGMWKVASADNRSNPSWNVDE